jgi:hypothetical protein
MRKHGFLIAGIMFGLTWAGISRAEDQSIEQQLIDAMNKVFGVYPGFRTNAKGIVVEGSFKGFDSVNAGCGGAWTAPTSRKSDAQRPFAAMAGAPREKVKNNPMQGRSVKIHAAS